MASIVNHQIVPHQDDYAFHLQNILEAKQSFLHGGLLLRVAPTIIHQGMLYPIFQFYTPTIYTIAGIISFISTNPMDPFKYTIGLCIVLGAFYCYRLYVFLFRNEIAALLGGLLYLFSPYLLINIDTRGDFTEAATQGLVPVMLFYSFKLFYQKNWDKETIRLALISIFAFYILSTSHLITFLFSSLFMFLLFFLLSIKNKDYSAFLRVLACFFFAILLSSWYLIPLVKYEHLLNMGAHTLYFPWDTAFFTQLSTLLSVKLTNIAPFLDGYPLYPSIGLPILIAIIYWIYKLAYEKGKTIIQPNNIQLFKSALWVFALAFFIIWSPIDFWKILPREAYVVQFPYRLLTDIMWIGGLLFTACLVDLFKDKLTAPHLVIGGFLIVIAGAFWLPNNYSPSTGDPHRNPMDIKIIKDLSTYTNIDYLAAPDQNPVLPTYNPATNPHLLTLAEVKNNCQQKGVTSVCTITNKSTQITQLPILYYPNLLEIKVDGAQTPYAASNAPGYLVAAVTLTPGSHTVISKFTGLTWANRLSAFAWILYIISAFSFYFYNRKRQKS